MKKVKKTDLEPKKNSEIISPLTHIIIEGARTHNLKNIDIAIPKNKLVVITGVSGSGKTSLAFETIYAEGQIRYLESLSAYARQFLQQTDKPDVDSIEGLSPAISIEQKTGSHNPRSTVGTVTEIYDYLRLLFARIGIAQCPIHKHNLTPQSIQQIVDHILKAENNNKCFIIAVLVNNRKGEFQELFSKIRSLGFTKVKIDGELLDILEVPALDKNKKHNIELVVDKLTIQNTQTDRIKQSIELALKYGSGRMKIANIETHNEHFFSSKFACKECDYSIAELEPKIFSFNNPSGACSACSGLGVVSFFDPEKIIAHIDQPLADGAITYFTPKQHKNFEHLLTCSKKHGFSIENSWSELTKENQQIILYGDDTFSGVIHYLSELYQESTSNHVREELNKYQSHKTCGKCNGARLKIEAQNVFVNNKSIVEITSYSIAAMYEYMNNLKLTGNQLLIANKITSEITKRLDFLMKVGLQYLHLSRNANTLSGGESQRIRLARQIGAGLTGVIYVLDEPSIGLHQRDNDKLIEMLFRLRDIGNTVIVVEHDTDTIKNADHIIDIGKMAGIHGGHLIAEGDYNAIIKNKESLTAEYLTGTRSINVPKTTRDLTKGTLSLTGARSNNLKNVTLNIPVGCFVCITGVSGSGKSSLINDTLYPILANRLNRANMTLPVFDEIKGLEHFDKVINISQASIGKLPISNPATYTGLFTLIRNFFTELPMSKERGYGPGRFSFNVPGGRCESCKGHGYIKVEMYFLSDVLVKCETCEGKRYNLDTLEVRYKGFNIHDVLEMSVVEALELFSNIPTIKRKLNTLNDVGLGYIKLGQPANTISGGESQRVKLALELSRKDTGKTLYILDEPTTGLHFYDIDLLLKTLHRLVNEGNTVVVIEHNLDVIKTADYIIDIGPEGGNDGGEIIAEGTPQQLVKNKISYTAKYLKSYL
jgi:excinuclease ABC subunit A